MSYDTHKNFVEGQLASALTAGATEMTPTPAAPQWPTPPYNLVIWPDEDDVPSSSTAEIVRVTAQGATTLTIARAQEGTTAKAFAAGAHVMLAATAKVFTDIENAVEGKLALLPEQIQFGGVTGSFPMLQRNGPALDIKKADDSGWAGVSLGGATVYGMLSFNGYYAGLQLPVGNSPASTAPGVLFFHTSYGMCIVENDNNWHPVATQEWAEDTFEPRLPDQIGQQGKYLRVSAGGTLEWAPVAAVDYVQAALVAQVFGR